MILWHFYDFWFTTLFIFCHIIKNPYQWHFITLSFLLHIINSLCISKEKLFKCFHFLMKLWYSTSIIQYFLMVAVRTSWIMTLILVYRSNAAVIGLLVLFRLGSWEVCEFGYWDIGCTIIKYINEPLCKISSQISSFFNQVHFSSPLHFHLCIFISIPWFLLISIWESYLNIIKVCQYFYKFLSIQNISKLVAVSIMIA